jgi:hypothetical protein
MPALWFDEHRDTRYGAGQAAALGADMKIDLSAEERRVLLRLIKEALDSAKYPLAPGLKVLRDLADKLRGEEKARG